MLNKKSDITISFSWIFMIIVGTFFILLSYNIVSNFLEFENKKNNIRLEIGLKNLFGQLGRVSSETEYISEQISTNAFKRGSKIEFECEENVPILIVDGTPQTNNYYVEKFPLALNKITIEKNTKLYGFSQRFDFPFYITNFIALFSDQNLIVIDEGSSNTHIKKLKKKFDTNTMNGKESYIKYDFNEKSIEDFITSKVKGKNIDSITFVTDTDLNLSKKEFNKIQVYKINLEYNKIIYYDKEKKSYNFSYFDYEDNYAIPIFAAFTNPKNFKCFVSSLQDSINTSFTFKTYLVDKFDEKKLCSGSSYEYNRINFSSLHNSIKEFFDNKQENGEINTRMGNLEDFNLAHLKADCPTIF